MLFETFVIAVLVSGGLLAVAALIATKENLDDRLFGCDEETEESYGW